MQGVSPKTKKIFFVSIAAVLITGSLFGFGVSFVLGKHSEALTARNEALRLAQAASSRKNVELAFQKTEEARTRLDTFLVQKDEDIVFLEDLERLATIAKVSAQNSTVSIEEIGKGGKGAASSEKKFQYLKVVGSATGSFSNVYHFLRLLEEFPKASELQDVKLDFVGGSEGKTLPTWKLSFVLRVLKVK